MSVPQVRIKAAQAIGLLSRLASVLELSYLLSSLLVLSAISITSEEKKLVKKWWRKDCIRLSWKIIQGHPLVARTWMSFWLAETKLKIAMQAHRMDSQAGNRVTTREEQPNGPRWRMRRHHMTLMQNLGAFYNAHELTLLCFRAGFEESVIPETIE